MALAVKEGKGMKAVVQEMGCMVLPVVEEKEDMVLVVVQMGVVWSWLWWKAWG